MVVTLIKKMNMFRDQRGVVFEPVDQQTLALQQNVHVVISHPGSVRGNHRHHKGTETIAVTGPALVRWRDGDGVNDVRVPEGGALCFVFPPGVAHAIKNSGDQPNFLIAFNTLVHDSRQPDTVSDPIL